MNRSRVVLAFSGGAGALEALAALRSAPATEIVTVTLDLGQGREIDRIRDQALEEGAVRAHVVDATRAFADTAILPALRAGIVSADAGPWAIELTRPIIARTLVEIAGMEDASAVAHGARGADARRLTQLVHDLRPGLPVEAPSELAAPRAAAEDRNLWGRTIRSREAAGGWDDLPPALYTLTKEPPTSAGASATVEISFERGAPTAVNGVALGLVELIEVVETIAGDHAVGRFDSASPRGGRRIVESPAAVVLSAALRDLERAVLDDRLLALKTQLAAAYAAIVNDGAWFSPAREALDAFVQASAGRLCGTVRLQLSHGTCRVAGRRADPLPSDAPAVATA